MCVKYVLNISICNTIEFYETNTMTNDHFVNEAAIIKAFLQQTKLQMFVVSAGWFVVNYGNLSIEVLVRGT